MGGLLCSGTVAYYSPDYSVAMAQAQNIATNAIPAGLSVTSVAVKEESNVTSVMLKPHWYAQTAMGKGEDNLSLY
jgi:hypothetical protein